MSTVPRKFDFDKIKVEEKMVDFRRVVMEDEQREIVDELTLFLAKFIDIFHNTLRSFLSLAISLWQTSEKKFLKDINDTSPEVRYQTVEEISVYLKSLLTGLLVNKGQKADLENAITEALKLYKDTWANR
ncbi:MAG: hypothetical protein ACW99A_10460 [Candidatus Kariarchaeaceae archaeon]|jgi:uncharacterized protein YaaR (DUF327 family)